MGKIKALLTGGLTSLCASIKAIRATAESAGSAVAQVAQTLADHTGEMEDVLGAKQDKLTGTAGQLVGFDSAGEAGALDVAGGDISAAQVGTNLAFSLKNTGVTAGTFGAKTSLDVSCVWTSNNSGANSSTAQTTLTAKHACTVSFDYSYSSEANYDKFTLTVGGTTVENAVSGTTTNKSYSGNLTSGQTIVFTYSKDGSQNVNDDRCTFSNFTVKVGDGAAVSLNSHNIGNYFTVTDGTYRFAPEDRYINSSVVFPEVSVDEKGRITGILEKQIPLGEALFPHSGCTIPITGWTSDSTAGFPYYFDLNAPGVTAADRADVCVLPTGISAAIACGLCPTTETFSGKIRLRAMRVPTTAISAVYWLLKA